MKKLLTVLFVVVALVSFSLTVIDDIGRVVTFETPVNRVICAAPSISDFISTLNLKGKVVGVTDWDTSIGNKVTYVVKKGDTLYGIMQKFGYSDVRLDEIKKINNLKSNSLKIGMKLTLPLAEKIGNMVPLNIEKIMELNPDVVFLTGGFQEPEVKKLEKYGIKAFVINPTSFNDIFRDISVIGTILGRSKEAEALSSSLRAKMISIAKSNSNKKNKPRVMYAMISNNVSTIWTAGTGSFTNELIAYAGGLNLVAPYTGNNGWLSVGPEFVVNENPDAIIVPSYYPGDTSAKDKLMSAEQFKEVSAIKSGKIILIDGNKASQASPSLISVLEDLNKKIGELN